MIQNDNKIDSPLGEDSTSLYAAQIVCVGFRSLPGEGAASCEIPMKITKKLATKLHEGTRRKIKKSYFHFVSKSW